MVVKKYLVMATKNLCRESELPLEDVLMKELKPYQNRFL